IFVQPLRVEQRSFFLKEEDGIRERNVTGVQTYALTSLQLDVLVTNFYSKKLQRKILKSLRKMVSQKSSRLTHMHTIFSKMNIRILVMRRRKYSIIRKCYMI